jgi:hypothetical protein
MSNNTAKKKGPIPKWAWLFAVACFTIPVVSLGGAIQGALGGGAGGYCLDYSRKLGLTVRARMVRCAIVVVAAWLVFFAFMAAVRPIFASRGNKVKVTTKTLDSQGNEVETVSYKSRSSLTDLDDEAIRRKIYSKAMRMYDELLDAKKRLDEDRRVGRDTAHAERQLDHIQGMHDFDIDFTMKFHHISREQLDAVIAEGDEKGWPRD